MPIIDGIFGLRRALGLGRLVLRLGALPNGFYGGASGLLLWRLQQIGDGLRILPMRDR
ncbi:hypothetical protein D3C81_2076680 [compost metagenome]